MIERTMAVAAMADRLARSVRVRRALLALGVAGAVAAWVLVTADPHTGWDAHAYWAAPTADPYANSRAGAPDAYLYAPAFRQAIAPLTALSWPAFQAVWVGVLLVALVWLTGPLAILALAVPIVGFELQAGNIEILLAAAIVLGFRYPAAWSFVLLTKLTPGVGLVWFAVRREWRSLAIALGATAAVVAVSFVLAPGLWPAWVDALVRNMQAVPPPSTVWIPPLWSRLAVAALLVVLGAVTNRRWTVPVAATFAMPLLYEINTVVLLALVPLIAPEARRFVASLAGRDPASPSGSFRAAPAREVSR